MVEDRDGPIYHQVDGKHALSEARERSLQLSRDERTITDFPLVAHADMTTPDVNVSQSHVILGDEQFQAANAVVIRNSCGHKLAQLADDLDGDEVFDHIEDRIICQSAEHIREEASKAAKQLEEGEQHWEFVTLLRETGNILL